MHPLSRPTQKSPFPKYTGDGSAASLAQWAKQIPVKETVMIDGKPCAVFNLRQRITILSPSYCFQVTEYYMNSYVACLQPTARYRMPDGSISVLPIVADRINVPNDSHIDRARNVITNIWVDQDITDLAYWWDVDIPVAPEFMVLIWWHLVNGVKFICGHYAMKDLIPTFVANVAARPKAGAAILSERSESKDPSDRIDPNLHELLDGGTGSMGWHRDVPLTLRKHAEVKPYLCAPNSPFANKIHFTYFSSGVYGPGIPWADLTDEQRATITAAKSGAAASASPMRSPEQREGSATTGEALAQWLSEDWKVCRLWQELGGKVYGDRRIKLQHFGGLLYPPTVDALTQATQAMIRGNHPAVQADKLRAALSTYREADSARMPNHPEPGEGPILKAAA